MPQPTKLPLVPLLKQSCLFPSLVLRLNVSRKDTAALLSKLVHSGNTPHLVACVPQRADAKYTEDELSAELSEIKDNLNDVGCLGKVLRIERSSSGFVAVIEGVNRIVIERVSFVNTTADTEGLEADVLHHDARTIDSSDVNAQSRLSSLKTSSSELITTLKGLKLPAVLLRRLENFIQKADIDNAGQLCDLMVSVVESTYLDKLAVLSAINVSDRLAKVHEMVSKQLNTIKVSRKISSSVDQTLNKQQKEFILRQKMSAIKKELGQLNGDSEDGEGEEDDASEYRKKIDAAELSVEAKQVAEKELKRLKRMQPQQAEYQVIRTYLDNILEIPWTKQSQSQALEAKSIAEAKQILDDDHFGLEKVKKRLIEYLAILRLRQGLERERLAAVKVDSKL